ncbi:MAG: hypothetical protein NTW96_24325 [Planctomycetia bacterium]|nr:hypothetical protein [Planctomycetia bacterium]
MTLRQDPVSKTWSCDECGWTFRARTPAIRDLEPHHACQSGKPSPPRESGPVDPAALIARLLAEIDAAILAGQMAPWSYFPRDRAAVAALLATHCQPCPELSRAGCERVPWPCKRWSLWRQTVLVGWCKRWGQRAVDGSR